MLMQIKANGDSTYKITWVIGITRVFYKVGVQALAAAATQVRQQLDLLGQCENGVPGLDRRTILINLALAGQSMHRRLFSASGNQNAAAALAWMRQCEDRELHIDADAAIGIPWGVMYDHHRALPPAAMPFAPYTQATIDSETENESDLDIVRRGKRRRRAEREIHEFSGFWCMRFTLSSTASLPSRSPNKWTRPRANFGILSIINSEVRNQLATDLDPADFQRFEKMLEPPIGVPEDFDAGIACMGSTPKIDLVLHVFCHHTDQTLIINDSYRISFDNFGMLLDELCEREDVRAGQGCALVFLNGCDTAFGDKDLSLWGFTYRPEVCGLIGTEAQVRRAFAARFGLAFLSLLSDTDMGVAEVMHLLHNEPTLWPESLIYGCYAHPKYCIARPQPNAPHAVAA